MSETGGIVRRLRFRKSDPETTAVRLNVSDGLLSIVLANTGKDQVQIRKYLVMYAVTGEKFGYYPIFRSWAHVSWLSALESVEAIERSSPQTSPLSECLYLNFVTLFLRSEARCRLARQLQSQLLNEQLGVCGRLRVARQN